ncbi:MAG: TIGR01459 family HAD-type hydrolase [Rhizobiales bacterium]|nr:TIGR01459 family HAD-type hydrolase [Hyphomicrobiales bacterium]
MRRIWGLSELAASFDAVLCDVWGVLHNGLAAFPGAVEALQRFRSGGGRVVLVTNAPRPAAPIRAQLRSLGVPDDAYDALVTSGDVTRAVIAERPGAKLLHIGADRDLPFYEGLDVTLVPEADAELVSCTGLFDDEAETPGDYRALLERLAARRLTMVCANPDLVVERGDRLLYCAGALARLYEELGGEAVLVGKPHAPIYRAARRLVAELGGATILAIGDGLPTDIRGACDNGLDVLFVTGGIHSADFGPTDDPDGARVEARLSAERLSAVAFLPTLVWDKPPPRRPA